MLTVSVNVVGEHGELDEELAEPYKQEFEDISDVLEQAGLPRFNEPDAVIGWGAADDHRKYHERVPVHSLHLLRRAYTAMKTVRELLLEFCLTLRAARRARIHDEHTYACCSPQLCFLLSGSDATGPIHH
jgi:hypothetical protein